MSTVAHRPEAGRARCRAGSIAAKRTVIDNGQQVTLSFPVAQTPVRVEVYIAPTFRASESDPRQLGAQVGFKFRPARRE